MITHNWWQVEIVLNNIPKAFGFATDSTNTEIVDHPNWEWKGRLLKEYKPFLLRNQAKVYFIAEQIVCI